MVSYTKKEINAMTYTEIESICSNECGIKEIVNSLPIKELLLLAERLFTIAQSEYRRGYINHLECLSKELRLRAKDKSCNLFSDIK